MKAVRVEVAWSARVDVIVLVEDGTKQWQIEEALRSKAWQVKRHLEPDELISIGDMSVHPFDVYVEPESVTAPDYRLTPKGELAHYESIPAVPPPDAWTTVRDGTAWATNGHVLIRRDVTFEVTGWKRGADCIPSARVEYLIGRIPPVAQVSLGESLAWGRRIPELSDVGIAEEYVALAEMGDELWATDERLGPIRVMKDGELLAIIMPRRGES